MSQLFERLVRQEKPYLGISNGADFNFNFCVSALEVGTSGRHDDKRVLLCNERIRLVRLDTKNK